MFNINAAYFLFIHILKEETTQSNKKTLKQRSINHILIKYNAGIFFEIQKRIVARRILNMKDFSFISFLYEKSIAYSTYQTNSRTYSYSKSYVPLCLWKESTEEYA